MAIEDDEPKDREVWSNVSRFWYNKASDKTPSVGRLYHHLAILARPYTWEQLSLYGRSLTSIVPFESARGSIMTLLNPILHSRDATHRRSSSFETLFIKAHAILFTSSPMESPDAFNAALAELEKGKTFENFISKAGPKFKDMGVHAAVSNIAAIFEYGTPKVKGIRPILLEILDAHNLRDGKEKTVSTEQSDLSSKITESQDMDLDNPAPSLSESSLHVISQASRITFFTLSVSLTRLQDKNVYPMVHVYLAFLWKFMEIEAAMTLFEKDVPWQELCSYLNSLISEFDDMKAKNLEQAYSRLESDEFPKPEVGIGRPLTEDFIIRGQNYDYLRGTWFSDASVDDDERTLAPPSMHEPRVERILWIARRSATVCEESRNNSDLS